MVNRKIRYSFLFMGIIIISSCLFPPLLHAALPAINRPVNDYAGIIHPYHEKLITDLILSHRKKTGVQIAVLTVGSTGKMSIEEYSLKVAEKWGGGSEDRDDGLLFTIAVHDRRMRLEVGYGLEGYIPDYQAKYIIDRAKDDFKKFKYGDGVIKVINAIIKETESLSAGTAIPASGKITGLFFRGLKIHWVFFLLSSLFGILYMVAKNLGISRIKMGWLRGILYLIGFLAIWGAFPILLQRFMPGAWYWRPVIFATAALAGASIFTALTLRRGKIVGFIFALLPAAGSLVATIFCLDVNVPSTVTGTRHETILLTVLIFTNIFQLPAWLVMLDPSFGSGTSYTSRGSYTGYSGSSYSSSSYSSSSSSSGSSYSGGGGSFGGGGASSSW